ncbi:hypothetical protein BDN72DRAFT_522748 [Pluteus cervinus]|uniref:Uncharacterized protein n=1 Tax=Pluteus cervinus TaxID=181527 RepID=A0ACD3A6W4_9AGAR|nr:hypothetical protein BDN72DRAFT_522748 [Pluteus cervinus]
MGNTGSTGYGGNLEICNSTPYTWNQTYLHSYQMNSWNWPTTLGSGQCTNQYIEYDTTVGKTVSDDGGDIEYTFGNAGYKILVQAGVLNDQYHYRMWLKNFGATNPNIPGSPILPGAYRDYGFAHDGTVHWHLGGSDGAFIEYTLNAKEAV